MNDNEKGIAYKIIQLDSEKVTFILIPQCHSNFY